MPMRPRAETLPSRPDYEDFWPMTEWKQDEESNTLLLMHLPDFHRENLEVSTIRKSILRIRGERLIGDNKWRRFQEDYPLPEHSNIRGIRAILKEDILTIIIPIKRNPYSDYILFEPSHYLARADQVADEKTREILLGPDPKMFNEVRPRMRNQTETKDSYRPDYVDKSLRAATNLVVHESIISARKATSTSGILQNTPFSKYKHHNKVEIIEEKSTEKSPELETDKDIIIADSDGFKNYKQMFMDLKEERKFLVNVVAALLVIVTLGGVYIFYRF